MSARSCVFLGKGSGGKKAGKMHGKMADDMGGKMGDDMGGKMGEEIDRNIVKKTHSYIMGNHKNVITEAAKQGKTSTNIVVTQNSPIPLNKSEYAGMKLAMDDLIDKGYIASFHQEKREPHGSDDYFNMTVYNSFIKVVWG